jgi:hypothetical protein
MSDFSVPDGGIPHNGIDDVLFPLEHAEAAYDAVTRLLAAIDTSATTLKSSAEAALVGWTGPYADYFRDARTSWLAGRQIHTELKALHGRLLAALKAYQDLQLHVIRLRRQAEENRPRAAHFE